MHEGKTDQPARISRHNARDPGIRPFGVTVNRGEDDRLGDPRRGGAAKIWLYGRIRVPRRRHKIAFAGVTMGVHNHDLSPSAFKNQMLVAMPLKKFGRWNFSLGACKRSS